MIQSIRRWRRASAGLSITLLSLTMIAVPAFAMEPQGHLQLSVGPIQEETGSSPLVVRLSIRPFVPLDDVTLTISAPVQIAPIALDPAVRTGFRPVPDAAGRQATRAALDPLRPQTAIFLEFELIRSTDNDGILEFTVAGVDRTGREIRDSIGFAVRGSGSNGTERLGAIEFPAAVLPDAEGR